MTAAPAWRWHPGWAPKLRDARPCASCRWMVLDDGPAYRAYCRNEAVVAAFGDVVPVRSARATAGQKGASRSPCKDAGLWSQRGEER